MNPRTLVPLVAAVLLLVGCESPSAPPPFQLNKKKSVEITPVDEEFNQQRATADSAHRTRKDKNSRTREEMTEGELYALPKFTVTRKGFLNLGLSVVTNSQVALGGSIEWMRVGVVLPGSPAAQHGMFTGVEILAIDGVPIARLTRENMLHLLFERESGEHVRLLVYSRHFGSLPLFVTLAGSSRPRQ